MNTDDYTFEELASISNECVRDLLAEVKRLNYILDTFDEVMCNNWTPESIHSIWNELLTRKEE